MIKSKYQILSTFPIRILAMVLMTLDHIGLFMWHYASPSYEPFSEKWWTLPMNVTGYVFRAMGRLALPLFILLFIEAMRHTSDRKKYLMRLIIMALLMLIVNIIFTYALKQTWGSNIFLLLLCAGSFIYFFELKSNKRYFMLIPCAYIILCFSAEIYACCTGGELLWFPTYLHAEYSLFGFFLCVLGYFIYYLADQRVINLSKNVNHKTIEELRTYPYYRSFVNIMWSLLLVVINLVFFLLSYIRFNTSIGVVCIDPYNMSIQAYSMIAVFIIMMYNGNKGYSSKPFKITYYLYYPIHLVLLFIVFFATFGH